MKRKYFIICTLIFLLFIGCSTGTGRYPTRAGTQVDLSRKNYRMVKVNAIGVSYGFRLLGIIPFASRRHTEAMSDLYEKAGLSDEKAFALINVADEESTIYLILFSLPKLTVRADVIEFIDEVTKPECTVLPSPNSLSPSCDGIVSTTTPTLSWSSVDNASGYVVKIFSGSNCSEAPIHTSTQLSANTTSYVIPNSVGFQSGQTYAWQVQAKGNGTTYCDSNWSNCCSFTFRSVSRGCTDEDLGEPNNSFDSAYPLGCNSSYTAKICSSTDEDYYRVVSSASGTITVKMTPPTDKNYELQIYNSSQQQIYSSQRGTYVQKVRIVSVTEGKPYYIRVIGDSSFSTASTYNLEVVCSIGD